MRKYFLILISTLILTASPALAENGSTTLTTSGSTTPIINSPTSAASFTFNFGDKKGAKDYPTISTFESADATLDFDKNIFTASASNVPGEDLIALIADFNPETNEIRGTFTGFQNYESKDGKKSYTRTSFDGTFSGKIEPPVDPTAGLAEVSYTGSSTVIFSKVFCSKLYSGKNQICPTEDVAYKGSIATKGVFVVVAPRPAPVPIQVTAPEAPISAPVDSPIPLIKYGAFLFVIALIVYTIYFAVSGGFF